VEHGIGDGGRGSHNADLANRLPAQRAGVKIRLADRELPHDLWFFSNIYAVSSCFGRALIAVIVPKRSACLRQWSI